MPTPPPPIITAYASEFTKHRGYAENAASQLPWPLLRVALDAHAIASDKANSETTPATNSIAVIFKHLAGNLRSRWTDPFTTDGEKPWRDRDREFFDDFASREAMLTEWSVGWAALEGTLAILSDADLARTLTIRGQTHTLALALTRSLAHAAYHTGQVVLIARGLASRHGLAWKTLTIPRGQSRAFNASLGFDPGANPSQPPT